MGIGFAFDVDEQFWTVLYEERMVKLHFLVRTAHLVEVIHVELTNERVQVGVLKVPRKNYLCEFSLVNYLKRCSVIDPFDQVDLADVVNHTVET